MLIDTTHIQILQGPQLFSRVQIVYEMKAFKNLCLKQTPCISRSVPEGKGKASLFIAMLGIKPRALVMLGKYPSPEVLASKLRFCFISFIFLLLF